MTYIWYRIKLKEPNRPTNFWLAAEDRDSLGLLLEKKGYTEKYESIEEDPTFPECLNKKDEKEKMPLSERTTSPL